MKKIIIGNVYVLVALAIFVSVQGAQVAIAQVDSGWGSYTVDSGWGNTAVDSGWGSTVVDTGWGNTAVDSGWGSTVVDSGWGNTTVSPTTGWGNTAVDSGWGNTTVSDSGWGNTTVSPTTGWGNTAVDSGWGNTTVSPTTGWGNTTVVTPVTPVVNSGTYTYTPGYSYTTGGTQYSSPSYTSYSYPSTYTTGSTYGTTYTTVPSTNVTVCSDGYAPTNGSCIRTTTITTTNTTICSDGRAPVNGSCVRTSTIPTVTQTICSDGRAPVNGSCVRTNTVPTTNTTICSDGRAPINGSCVRTSTIPTVTQTICSDGGAPVNGSCVRINTIPTVTYQTCWNGSVIPSTSVCVAQYKTCPNGTSVPVNQACYVTATPVYVAPQVVKFNNVVTSVATEISKTSGRCNGIGLIANNAQSTGWFEYGETPNLGRTTATANIGSANTAPFSNVLANLKPSTKYYCRAVMQNQYGLVKGEIVGFTTKANVVTYVKPVTTKPPVATPAKTNIVTCSDGSTFTTKSTSSATLLSQGEKLLAVQVEKINGNLVSGEQVQYKVTYKNLVDTRLSGVLVKVTMPQEVIFAGATAGNYDPTTRTLTLTQDTIDPYSEGVIIVTANVQKDAPIGKTIVTNVYAMYTVPGTQTQDEVSAYVIGSIMPATAFANQDTGAKKVIGASNGRGFMPNTLIEWLALLAILFIIFILGRSVYASYKDDEDHKH